MNSIDELLSDSVHKVLSKKKDSDQKAFYDILNNKYHFTFENISETFYTFHLALKENYGLQHYTIEREIISTMHEDTKEGKYQVSDEIAAFSIITKIVIDDNKRTLEVMKKSLDESEKHLDNIEQTNQSDKRVQELKDIERFNKFRMEIQESLENQQNLKKH